MRIVESPWLLLFMMLSIISEAQQVNPLLKQYAGTYYKLGQRESKPTGFSEKMVLTADGRLTTTYFPLEYEGAARVAQKRTGTWSTSEVGIKLNIIGIDPATKKSITIEEEYKLIEPEYRLREGTFSGYDGWLVKLIVTNPAFLTKYAGKYNLVRYSSEVDDYTPIIVLKADGTCSKTALESVPVKGTWKAIDGVIQLSLKEKNGEEITEFAIKDGLFTDVLDYQLKKVVPPPPPSPYFSKYAGTYQLFVGETRTTDKYMLKADGTGTLATYFDADGNPSTTPIVSKGTWKASEGLIQLYIFPDDGGRGGDHDGGLITDYRLENGVFRAGDLILKKVVKSAPPKK